MSDQPERTEIFGLAEAVAYLEKYNPPAVGKVERFIRDSAERMVADRNILSSETLGFHLARMEDQDTFWVWVCPRLWAESADGK